MSARDDILDEYGRADTAPLGTLPELRAKLDAHRAEVEREVRAELIAGFRSVAADIASAVPPIEAGPRTEFERGLMVAARSIRLHADELEAGGAS